MPTRSKPERSVRRTAPARVLTRPSPSRVAKRRPQDQRYPWVGPLDLRALGIELPPLAEEHPNRLPFRGTLTRVDEASTRSPHGAQGHRVRIPRAVAEQALPSLIGMAVDVSDRLTDHTTQKIGLITEAHLEGQDLKVAGFLYAKDFPAACADIQRKRDRLGMSYEITDVQVVDPQAAVWVLSSLVFTGAAILEKTSAAYERTSLYARGARKGRRRMARDTLAELRKLNTQLSATLDTFQAEGDEDDEDARREGDADARGREDADAGGRHGDADARGRDDDEDAGGPHDEDAKMDDEEAAFLARMARARSRLMKAGRLQAEHEDEAEDEALIRRLLQEQKAARATPVKASVGDVAGLEAQMKRRFSKLEAGMELLTDSVAAMTKLLTDQQGTYRDLKTDHRESDADGGMRARTNGVQRPVRKTISASESGQYLSKYGFEAGQKYSTAQVDEGLRQAGVSDPTQRIAFKHHLESVGMLAD